MDMPVGEGNVLKDREEAVLAVQPPDQLGDRVQPGERMQRPAMVPGRKVGGASHRQRRGRQHGLSSDAAPQLLQRAVQDLGGGCLFDEPDQWLDMFRKLDACVHHGLLGARA